MIDLDRRRRRARTTYGDYRGFKPITEVRDFCRKKSLLQDAVLNVGWEKMMSERMFRSALIKISIGSEERRKVLGVSFMSNLPLESEEVDI